MMLLLCHDIHIGFPLVPIMLEAFYKHNVTNIFLPSPLLHQLIPLMSTFYQYLH